MKDAGPTANRPEEGRGPVRAVWLRIGGLALLANGYGSASFVSVIGPGLWTPATAGSIWASMTLVSAVAALAAFAAGSAVVGRFSSSLRLAVAIGLATGAIAGPIAARVFASSLGLPFGELAPETWLRPFPM